MAIKNGTTGVNTGYGKIDLKGEGSVGVYNDNSNFEMRSEVAGKSEDGKTPSISVSGKNTIGVYAKGNKSTTKIKSGIISAEKGINLYADNSVIELGRRNGEGGNGYFQNSPLLETKNGALMFYNYSLNGNTQKADGVFLFK